MRSDYNENESKIFVRDRNGTNIEYDLSKFLNPPVIKKDDIVKVWIDSSAEIVDIYVLMDRASSVYDVIDVDYNASGLKSITVEVAGEIEIIPVIKDVAIFGDSVVEKDNTISFALDADDQIIAIQVLR